MRPPNLAPISAALLASGALLLLSCSNQPTVVQLPPSGSFYTPSGLAFDDSQVDGGMLYVSSANFDRRFTFGDVMAVPLAQVGPNHEGLPPIGSVDAGTPPRSIYTLNASGPVYIQNFAGEMRVLSSENGGPQGLSRVIVPSRDVDSRLYFLDAQGTSLTCPNEDLTTLDCTGNAPSLTALEKKGNGKPRAPEPFGVGLTPPKADGSVDLFVTHMRPADEPVGSLLDNDSYVVDVPNVGNPDPTGLMDLTDPSMFIHLATDSSQGASVALGPHFAYVTGRRFTAVTFPVLLWLVDWRDPNHPVYDPGLVSTFVAAEGRAIAYWDDSKAHPGHARVYMVTRGPDSLVVLDINGEFPDSPLVPQITIVRQVPLPTGASELALIDRDGFGLNPLVAVTSSNNPSLDNIYSSSLQVAPNEGRLLIYDDDVGDVVAQLPQPNQVRLGTEPFAIAVQRTPDPKQTGARLFVSNLGDGRVAVADIADVSHPEAIQLVGWLGSPSSCIGHEGDPTFDPGFGLSCVESP